MQSRIIEFGVSIENLVAVDDQFESLAYASRATVWFRQWGRDLEAKVDKDHRIEDHNLNYVDLSEKQGHLTKVACVGFFSQKVG